MIGTHVASKSRQLARLPEADEEDEDGNGDLDLVMNEGYDDGDDERPSGIRITSGKGS